MAKKWRFCYSPFTLSDALRASLREPPATLLVLPNGWVKVAAALPHICADLRRAELDGSVGRVPRAWRDEADAGRRSPHAHESEMHHADAN